jgi:hypothetical protein
MRQSRRAILNNSALFVSDKVAVDSQRDSRVRVSQLPLHNSRDCAVCEQGTGSTVTQAEHCLTFRCNLF